MYFDSNELPSAAAAIPYLNSEEEHMLLGVNLNLLETYPATN